MATSKVQIANLALMHVGENAITSFADETNAARAIDQVYDVVRDAVLTDHTWNFAIKRLALSRDTGTPIFDFTYRFNLPTDYLRLVSIEDLPDYKISGQFIETDSEAINIKYVAENDIPNEYDSMFVMSLALRLGATIAERLTQSSALGKELMEAYAISLRDAKTVDAQSDKPDDLEANLWLDSRNKGTSLSGDL